MIYYTSYTTGRFNTIDEAVSAVREQGLLQVTIYNDDGMPAAQYGKDERLHYLRVSGEWHDPVQPLVAEWFRSINLGNGCLYELVLFICQGTFYIALSCIFSLLLAGLICLFK